MHEASRVHVGLGCSLVTVCDAGYYNAPFLDLPWSFVHAAGITESNPSGSRPAASDPPVLWDFIFLVIYCRCVHASIFCHRDFSCLPARLYEADLRPLALLASLTPVRLLLRFLFVSLLVGLLTRGVGAMRFSQHEAFFLAPTVAYSKAAPWYSPSKARNRVHYSPCTCE